MNEPITIGLSVEEVWRAVRQAAAAKAGIDLTKWNGTISTTLVNADGGKQAVVEFREPK